MGPGSSHEHLNLVVKVVDSSNTIHHLKKIQSLKLSQVVNFESDFWDLLHINVVCFGS